MMFESEKQVDAGPSGGAEAFETIVCRHGPALLGYLNKMTRNTEQAEEIFQETFMRAHEKANQFRGENLKGWLFTIASRLAISKFRRRRLATVSINQPMCLGDENSTLENSIADCSPTPDAQAQLEEKRRLVRSAIFKLPEKQRAALVLSYYHQLTYPQIAQALGCSVGAVKQHMFRALKRLSELLAEPAGGFE